MKLINDMDNLNKVFDFRKALQVINRTLSGLQVPARSLRKHIAR